MEQQGSDVRKTCRYKLKLTLLLEGGLERVLMLCRHVCNAAVEERREARQKCGVSVGYYLQKAELSGVKEAMPGSADVNTQVLQRVCEGPTPGYPRLHGRDRYNSFIYSQVEDHGGARIDNGFLVLSKIGHVAVRWSRPVEGARKTVTASKVADG
jgi:putative transposase